MQLFSISQKSVSGLSIAKIKTKETKLLTWQTSITSKHWMEMRKIEWKRMILLAKEYFYTSLFIFQKEQLVVNIAEKSKLKHFWIETFFFVQTSIWGMEGGQRLLRNPSQSRTQKEQKCWFIIRLKIFRISYFQKYFYKDFLMLNIINKVQTFIKLV